MTATEKLQPLAGKLALVTGGSKGIGAAISRRLAADGAAVVLNYGKDADAAQSLVDAIRSDGGRAEAVQADLGGNDGPPKLIADLDMAFGGEVAGRLDVLVNNTDTAAAGAVDETPPDEYLSTYDRLFALNVRAVVALTVAAAPRIKTVGWGRIVNNGSGDGERVSMGGITLYCATKFALAGLTRGWSRELGPHGVTVNATQLGPIETDLNPSDGPRQRPDAGPHLPRPLRPTGGGRRRRGLPRLARGVVPQRLDRERRWRVECVAEVGRASAHHRMSHAMIRG